MDKATPIYDRKLTLAEVRHRIQAYYEPYHAALSRAIGDTVRRFGAVWHLNLHSMPNDAYERLGGPVRIPWPTSCWAIATAARANRRSSP